MIPGPNVPYQIPPYNSTDTGSVMILQILGPNSYSPYLQQTAGTVTYSYSTSPDESGSGTLVDRTIK